MRRIATLAMGIFLCFPALLPAHCHGRGQGHGCKNCENCANCENCKNCNQNGKKTTQQPQKPAEPQKK
jgi:hypothetical protein